MKDDPPEPAWQFDDARIGKEFAETTTHFTDALNDILANGQKIFEGNKSGVE